MSISFNQLKTTSKTACVHCLWIHRATSSRAWNSPLVVFNDLVSLLCVSCSVVSDSLQSPWTVASQASLSMGFFRQEYWRFLSPGDLPDPGIKLGSPALPVDSLPSEPPGKPCFPVNIGKISLLFYSFELLFWFLSQRDAFSLLQHQSNL